MQKLKIYISGAITDNPDYEKQFKEAESELKEKYNCEIFSPLTTKADLEIMQSGGLITKIEWADYIIFGLMKLKNCNAIYVLPNSEKSYGSRIEQLFAGKLGIKEIDI